MSNMVEKMEQEIGDPLKNKALCPLSWFDKNLAYKIDESDSFGPTVISVPKPWQKNPKIEIWHRDRPLKSGDFMFIKMGEYPIDS